MTEQELLNWTKEKLEKYDTLQVIQNKKYHNIPIDAVINHKKTGKMLFMYLKDNDLHFGEMINLNKIKEGNTRISKGEKCEYLACTENESIIDEYTQELSDRYNIPIIINREKLINNILKIYDISI